MKKVVITGGIGSGKSTVAHCFECLGIPVYYADLKAKHLMTYDKLLKTQIKQKFGSDVYHRNGRLNRQQLASLVFKSKKQISTLNALVHPAVKRDFLQWASVQSTSYVIEESAIIIEIGGHQSFDFVILVTADEVVKIQRVMQRDNITKAQVKDRMKHQWSDEKKLPFADFVIDNSGTISIIDQVLEIDKKIRLYE